MCYLQESTLSATLVAEPIRQKAMMFGDARDERRFTRYETCYSKTTLELGDFILKICREL